MNKMPAIRKIWFDRERIFVEFDDQRIIDTPISLYPNLSKGTPEQRLRYEIWNNGQWLHWEELDEDLSADGFLLIQKQIIA
jgi:hypothetical protein